jgi:hypothetical protein
VTDQTRIRRRELLAEIRRTGGTTTTGQAHAFYRATGWGPCRTTARKDLQYYARQGVLVERGPDNGRIYSLNYAKGGSS